MTTTGIERSCLRYLPLFWPVWQSGAAVEYNDIILTLGLLSKQHVAHTPISHVSCLRITWFTIFTNKSAKNQPLFIVLRIHNFGWNASKQTKFELVHKYEMQMVSDASNTVSKYSCLRKENFCFNRYETFFRRLSRLFEKILPWRFNLMR